MRLLTYLFLFSFIGVTAQYNGNSFTMTHGQMELVYYDAPTVGSPYLDDMYKTGTTIISNNSETKRLMRYNAFSDEMEFLSKQDKPLKLLKKENIVVELDGKTYKVYPYRYKGKKAKGYFNPLNEGEVVLYLQPRKKLIPAENIEHGYDDIDPAQYLNDFNYYLKKGDNSLEKIDLGKKDILYVLRDRHDELKTFIKENDLKLRKESDALQVIAYYNDLAVN
ncbi:hypothetical protein [Eudoraea chungangensis]|uniref:hypothetical protein n=1 Tax=Eudoraea chungangensis TaxID=1481905 RepID=UPI0023EBDC88|nr:hypothetical protein [Eudoraea chungangensis]